MKKKQKFLSILLSLCLCIRMLPMTALAAEGDPTIDQAGYILNGEDAKEALFKDSSDNGENYTMYVKFSQDFTEATNLWFEISNGSTTYGIAGGNKSMQCWSFLNKGQFEYWPEDVEPGAPAAGEYTVTVYNAGETAVSANLTELPDKESFTEIGKTTVNVIEQPTVIDSGYILDAAAAEEKLGYPCFPNTMYIEYSEAFPVGTYLWYVITDAEGNEYGLAGNEAKVQAWSFNNNVGQWEKWPEGVEHGSHPAGEYKIEVYETEANYAGVTEAENQPTDAELTNKVAEKIVGVVAGESTVTFKANGGRFADDTTADKEVVTVNGKVVNIPEVTRNSYTFEGWFNGNDQVDNDYVFYEDTEVTAKWKSKKSGGSSGGSSVSTTYSVTVSSVENGQITVSSRNAKEDDTVTITVKPDTDYVLDKLTVSDKDGNSIRLTNKGNGEYTFTMPASRVTIDASFVKDLGLPFTDVANNSWYADEVAYVYENGLMLGTSNTNFSPNLTTNRGMIVTMLYRLEKEPAVTEACPFTDVSDGSWYENAIIWASANKIVEGYGDSNFGPEDSITREQMAAILYRYTQFKGYDLTANADISSFNDASQVSDWALNAMKWACGAGLIQGDSNNIMPTGNATRCQVAAILMRYCENIVK